MLSIIIPTLNAGATLGGAMKSLKSLKSIEVKLLVVDGGSADNTCNIAREYGAEVISSRRGRGCQLASGAGYAIENGATWLMFIHADCVLAPGWHKAVMDFINNPANVATGAYFKLAFIDGGNNGRRVAALANWRASFFGLPYGDQGLLVSTVLYNKAGGFDPHMDLMEDVKMARKIGKPNLACLDIEISTSPVRYAQSGWWARPIRNLACLALYFFGASQKTLKRIYK